MFTRQDYFFALGLGAQMVSLKYGLLHAILQGRVYHFPTSHYVNPVRCPSRSFDCYFEPASNCSRPAKAGRQPKGRPARNPREHRRAEDVKIHWCFDLPRRKLSRLAQLRAVHPAAWYHGQLAAFLFRPNAALRALRDEVGARMASSDAAAANRSLLANGSACAAMHVRRTDKHTEDHRVADRGFKDFGQVFRSWAYWRYGGPVPQLRVLLGSEDKATFGAMPRLLLPSVAVWIPAPYFVMDMSLGKQFKSIQQGNKRLAELYGLLEDQIAATHPRPTRRQLEARGLLKDEGMVLILQILMMSDCVAFIGSYSSNVAILVHDLMYARRVAQGEELHAMDVNGRVYCGCGASFCMQLERKAIRQPEWTVKQIVENFKY
eukprot:Transcript_14227.p1 GENE.Transcript_14227~~Transcript_14227.p1  ORF type:complete len:396 (+),score=166.23 Transcript_14227:59-1189(+)